MCKLEVEFANLKYLLNKWIFCQMDKVQHCRMLIILKSKYPTWYKYSERLCAYFSFSAISFWEQVICLFRSKSKTKIIVAPVFKNVGKLMSGCVVVFSKAVGIYFSKFQLVNRDGMKLPVELSFLKPLRKACALHNNNNIKYYFWRRRHLPANQ